jgi:DNA-binding response OmpR family regulator
MKDNQISQAGDSASAPLPREPNPPHHILVVDDDTFIRQFNTEVLIHSGYEVDAAADGTAAWEALGADNYDLLITDHDMPGLSGLDLVKKLHATRMALPIIMATGTLPKDEFTPYPWLQPAATLLKPYTKAELLGTVEEVLRATVSASSPREILLAAGSSGSAPPISRGEQIAPLPNWQSQPSADGLRL